MTEKEGPLFRAEAIEYASRNLYGDVLLLPRMIYSTIASISLLTVALVLSFAYLYQWQHHEMVAGTLLEKRRDAAVPSVYFEIPQTIASGLAVKDQVKVIYGDRSNSSAAMIRSIQDGKAEDSAPATQVTAELISGQYHPRDALTAGRGASVQVLINNGTMSIAKLLGLPGAKKVDQ